MGQSEILDFLQKQKVPLSSKEISEQMGIRESTILDKLRNMIKYSEVNCMELNKDLSMKFYKCKRRMRLYYVK